MPQYLALWMTMWHMNPHSQWSWASSLQSQSQALSGEDLFSTPKPFWSFSNSNLRHLWHSSDPNHLPVPEMLWSSSYSKPLPAIPNTTNSFHLNTSPNTSSKGCSETSISSEGDLKISSDSTPSNLNSALTFSRYSGGCSRDGVAPVASNIKVVSLE